jgi:hypothetical protein
MDVFVQVMVPPAAVAFGTLASGETVAVAVEVQPLVGLVTVSVYKPVDETVGDCKVELKLPGPDQAKVVPLVVEAPEMVVLLDEQVMIPPVAEALGATKSPATAAVVVDVQLLAGFVTVSV